MCILYDSVGVIVLFWSCSTYDMLYHHPIARNYLATIAATAKVGNRCVFYNESNYKTTEKI
jgi:hypothetical protein